MPKLNKWVDRTIEGVNQYAIEIDLEKIFDNVPNSSSFRQAVGQAAIDIIRRRTQNDNKSWTGSGFKKPYSKQYQESLAFQAAGKSANNVNLTLTGDMLGLMDIIEETETTIKIGWSDKLEANKAHGHISGNIGVKRDFLGLNEKEILELKDKFQDMAKETQVTEFKSSVQTLADVIEGRTAVQGTSLSQIITNLFDEGE
jgi:hypothetical protein